MSTIYPVCASYSSASSTATTTVLYPAYIGWANATNGSVVTYIIGVNASSFPPQFVAASSWSFALMTAVVLAILSAIALFLDRLWWGVGMASASAVLSIVLSSKYLPVTVYCGGAAYTVLAANPYPPFAVLVLVALVVMGLFYAAWRL